MDPRAIKILFGSYWTSTGWRPERDRYVSKEDFEYAKSAGVMFDPVESCHDDYVSKLTEVIARCEKRAVANAFLASLSSRRLDWRSPLGSYAVFRAVKPHVVPACSSRCDYCGMSTKRTMLDLNVLNFERLKWGGVRHSNVECALFDLSIFTKATVPLPTPSDLDIFREIIGACKSASNDVTSSSLHKQLPRSLKGNKAEKNTLIAILGFTGILGTTEHPGFNRTFVPFCARDIPNRRFVDMDYPACWWTGEDGVKQQSVSDYFGHVAL